ncbi:serine/threonine-protein kinase Nek7-like [Aplysia californica]|uniref:non-specific serine/threonine protein kinase n=1 Tax=Aplysia californica TaxID=6500 RepID=A0ABM0K3D2_APLCA|nr:serine/threonine-protein kinase Nek7-like [Aplysia californica]
MLRLRPPVFEVYSDCDVTEALGVSLDYNKPLGSGSSSKVYLATDENHPDNKKALKLLTFLLDERDSEELENLLEFEAEVQILQNVRHPNIIKMERAVKCPDEVAILMELHRSDLSHALCDISTDEASRYFTQLTDAVSFLHQHCLVHGDLKLRNVFISHCGNAVLGDFGQAQILPKNSTSSKRWGGTLHYWAPEYEEGEPVDDVFKLESYSLGLCLWALLFRKEPKSGTDFLQKLEDKVLIPDLHRQCVERLLCPSPSDRATVVEIQQLLYAHGQPKSRNPTASVGEIQQLLHAHEQPKSDNPTASVGEIQQLLHAHGQPESRNPTASVEEIQQLHHINEQTEARDPTDAADPSPAPPSAASCHGHSQIRERYRNNALKNTARKQKLKTVS